MADQKCTTLGLTPSFGFGDRTGLATLGHVAAMQQAGIAAGIAPIYPQQSIREMTRTGRTPDEVMRDAMNGAQQAGWTGPIGADADHLKTKADVDITAAAGFTFFTIDPSAFVDQHADDYSEATLREQFDKLRNEVTWVDRYRNQQVKLPGGSVVELTEEACLRAAVKYGRAINHLIELAVHIRDVQSAAGRPYEIELSVDETEQPTTLAEHYIISDQCRQHEVKLVSVAPRFVGDFEKGVDFKGDLGLLERSLSDHAAIAELTGPYKLSLHSGSDKLSIYPLLARQTKGRFHVKTAGTSYLEAVRVAARHDEKLFREIIRLGRERYDADKATYHVSATLYDAPSPDDVSDVKALEAAYLELWTDVPEGKGFTTPGRQILHCTFGSVLTHPTLGPALKGLLQSHPESYTEILADHFSRHLRALAAGL